MPQIISFIANVMVRETLLPYRPMLLAEPIRESTLDHLQRTLKRNILRGREQQMQMVGHDDEFMQHEFALLCIVLEHIDHELRRGMLAEDRGSFPCDRSDEERPLSIHSKTLPASAHEVSDLGTK